MVANKLFEKVKTARWVFFKELREGKVIFWHSKTSLVILVTGKRCVKLSDIVRIWRLLWSAGVQRNTVKELFVKQVFFICINIVGNTNQTDEKHKVVFPNNLEYWILDMALELLATDSNKSKNFGKAKEFKHGFLRRKLLMEGQDQPLFGIQHTPWTLTLRGQVILRHEESFEFLTSRKVGDWKPQFFHHLSLLDNSRSEELLPPVRMQEMSVTTLKETNLRQNNYILIWGKSSVGKEALMDTRDL